MKKVWLILAIVLGVLVLVWAYGYFFNDGNSVQAPANQIPANTDVQGGVPLNIDSATLDFPKPNSIIKSPVTISGQARGFWYFEASFPVQITDANGNVLGQFHAQAQSDWMTIELVPFTSTVTFTNSPTDTGFVVLKKDNPSGLPQNEAQVRFPIRFR